MRDDDLERLKKNLNLIKNYDPVLVEVLERIFYNQENIQYSKKEDKFFNFKKKYNFELFNSKRYKEFLLNKINNFFLNNYSIILFYFVANFLHIKKFIEVFEDKYQKIENVPVIFIIIEDFNIFLNSLRFVNIEEIFFKKKLSIKFFFIHNYTSTEKLRDFLNLYCQKDKLNVYNFDYKSYTNKFKNIKVLESFFYEELTKFASDLYTYKRLIYDQLKSILLNLKYLRFTIKKYNFPIRKLGILFAAGSSINEFDFDFIKKFRKSDIFIITVDTSLKFLLINGVIPDIVVSLDSQILNYYDFAGINLRSSLFISEISSNNKINKKLYENNYGPLFFSSVIKSPSESWEAANFLSFLISKKLGVNYFPTFGNITTASIVLGLNIFQNLIVVGFDRRFHKYIYHCKHALDYEYYLNNSNYFKNLLTNLLNDTFSRLYDRKNIKSLQQKKNDENLIEIVMKNPDRIFIANNYDEFYHITLQFINKKGLNIKQNVYTNQYNKIQQLKNEIKFEIKKEDIYEFKKSLVNYEIKIFKKIIKELKSDNIIKLARNSLILKNFIILEKPEPEDLKYLAYKFLSIIKNIDI